MRNGFRLYEYSRSYWWNHAHRGEFATNSEAEFYFLEFLPVYLVHAVFCLYNFGHILPGDEELAAMFGKGTVVVTPGAEAGAGAGVGVVEDGVAEAVAAAVEKSGVVVVRVPVVEGGK